MKPDLLQTEFDVLRQTISRRGTARMILVPVTVLGWAALALLLLIFASLPAAALFPLAVLVGGFEAIHALHAGTERIGRYLQVQYEREAGGPRWETTAMAVGPALPGGGIDPLFSVLFAGTTIVNMLPALTLPATPIELGVVGALHLLFLIRIIRARGAASRQRAVELESFKTVLARDRGAIDHPIP